MTDHSLNIQHFLKKDAEPVSYKSEDYFPLFIQIDVFNEKALIKSRLDEHLKIYQSNLEKFTNSDRQFHKLVNTGYFSENSLKTIINGQIFPIFQLLNDEIYVLKKFIDYKINKKSGDFNQENLERGYIACTLEISDILDDYIKNQYIEEVKNVFLQSVDKVWHGQARWPPGWQAAEYSQYLSM